MNIYKHLMNFGNRSSGYFDDDKVCFVDIETTGLSRKYNQIYLIGLMYFDYENKDWLLKQIFAHSLDEEKELLEVFHKLIEKFDLIVTYNGLSFDLPFIHHRSKFHSIESNLLDRKNFDIYRKIRSYNPFLQLKNLKLKTIEETLGIYREDEYSGKDCINFYYQYMNSKDGLLRDKILKHNYDDLYYLLDIMKIFDYIDNIRSTSINIKGKNVDVKIEDILITRDILEIHCSLINIKDSMKLICYQEGFTIDWRGKETFIVKLEFKEGLITPTKKCLFVCKSDFPAIENLEDLSQFVVPENLLLLGVENKYEMENIKNLLGALIEYVLVE